MDIRLVTPTYLETSCAGCRSPGWPLADWNCRSYWPTRSWHKNGNSAGFAFAFAFPSKAHRSLILVRLRRWKRVYCRFDADFAHAEHVVTECWRVESREPRSKSQEPRGTTRNPERIGASWSVGALESRTAGSLSRALIASVSDFVHFPLPTFCNRIVFEFVFACVFAFGFGDFADFALLLERAAHLAAAR